MRQLLVAGVVLSCVLFSQRANADAYVSIWRSSVKADDIWLSSSIAAGGARASGKVDKPDMAFGGAFGFATESGFEIEAEVSSRSQDMAQALVFFPYFNALFKEPVRRHTRAIILGTAVN